MLLEQLQFLATQDGTDLLSDLSEAANPLRASEKLRDRVSPELIAAARTLLALRERAKAKFAQPCAMFFTREALEQATAEPLAEWRAARFPVGATILDLCCGIGGDALALAERGTVCAFDRDPAAAFCCAENGLRRGASNRVRVACADVTRLRLRADAAFLDPSRRTETRRKVQPEDYSPPLSFAAAVAKRVGRLAVKVSPAVPDRAIEELGARAEFVSWRGECREAALWFGDFGPSASRSASILPVGATLASEGLPPPALSAPLGYLFEPDAAVVRAHLIGEAAARVDGRLLSPGIAYLTADRPSQTPFAACFKVVDSLPFHLGRLHERLRKRCLRAESIKKRGAPMDVDVVRRALPSEGERAATVVLTRVAGRPHALICERVRFEEETG